MRGIKTVEYQCSANNVSIFQPPVQSDEFRQLALSGPQQSPLGNLAAAAAVVGAAPCLFRASMNVRSKRSPSDLLRNTDSEMPPPL